jgi:5-methylcytosine-specific restriction endonuclease McrA
MQDLPDTPMLRKRAKLRSTYARSRQVAILSGNDLYFPDSFCPSCGTWATRRVSDDACGGCTKKTPYAGTAANKRSALSTCRGYYFGRNIRAKDGRKFYETDQHFCAACEVSVTGRINLDHIFPYVAGGPSEYWNFQILCSGCNREKGEMLPDEWFNKVGKPMPDLFASEFSKFHEAFSGKPWSLGDPILYQTFPAATKKVRKHRIGRAGRGADPTRITPDGKLILTPAKHWHKAFK